jgi:hypothetical protein
MASRKIDRYYTPQLRSGAGASPLDSMARGVLCDGSLKVWHRPGVFTSDPYWIDRQGNGNAYISGTAPQTVDLRGRTGLLFNGSSGYSYTGANTGISGDAALTFALWLDMRRLSDGDGICGIGATGTARAACGLYVVSSKPTIQFAGGNSITPPTALSLNAYTFVCVTIAAGAITAGKALYYYDGAYLGSNTASASGTPNITNSAFYVGRWADAAAYSNCLVSQAMLFNRVLGAGEVKALHDYFR